MADAPGIEFENGLPDGLGVIAFPGMTGNGEPAAVDGVEVMGKVGGAGVGVFISGEVDSDDAAGICRQALVVLGGGNGEGKVPGDLGSPMIV